MAVKLDATRQTIQGFGINTALMPDDKTVPVDKLFGTTAADAIGLSILRVGMNPNGTLTGKYVSEAKGMGAKVIGSTWSPPANCKSNNNTQKGGHLLESCYDSWSTTIANFAQAAGAVRHVDRRTSPTLRRAHPSDRRAPTTTIRRRYTAKQMVALVKVAGPKLKANERQGHRARSVGMDPRLEQHIVHGLARCQPSAQLGSAEVWLLLEHDWQRRPLALKRASTGMATTTATGSGRIRTAWDAFDIFGVHEYDSQIAVRVAGRRQRWREKQGGLADRDVRREALAGRGADRLDIDNGVAVAGWIHSALTVGEASAWLYWWYEAYYQNDNEGLALTQGSSTIAKRYFTLGNYSKFVRPGYVAVDVVGNSNANVLLSAYKGTDGTVVVVAINKGTAAATVPIADHRRDGAGLDDAARDVGEPRTSSPRPRSR